MNTFFRQLIIVFLFCSANSFYAQLDQSDSNKKKGNINLINPVNTKTGNKPKSISLNSTDGFKKAYKQQQEEIKKKQKEQNLNSKGILTDAKISEERFLKTFKKINGQYQYPVIDQDLGSFRTHSKSVNIICRDFQYPDGDRVTIYVNDIPVITNIVLKQQYQKFNIPLEVGINKIAFKALNQGTSGPNTAAFKVYNDAGLLISSNEWNLATGAKATILIAKDK